MVNSFYLFSTKTNYIKSFFSLKLLKSLPPYFKIQKFSQSKVCCELPPVATYTFLMVQQPRKCVVSWISFMSQWKNNVEIYHLWIMTGFPVDDCTDLAHRTCMGCKGVGRNTQGQGWRWSKPNPADRSLHLEQTKHTLTWDSHQRCPRGEERRAMSTSCLSLASGRGSARLAASTWNL